MQNRICQVRPSGSRKLRLETKGLFVCVCQLLTTLSHFLSFFSKALSNYSFFFFFTKTKNQHNTKAKFNSIPPSTTTLFCLVYIPKKKKTHTHKIRTLRARPSTPLSLSSLWGSPLSLSLKSLFFFFFFFFSDVNSFVALFSLLSQVLSL